MMHQVIETIVSAEMVQGKNSKPLSCECVSVGILRLIKSVIFIWN